jgi:hypothetical protein
MKTGLRNKFIVSRDKPPRLSFWDVIVFIAGASFIGIVIAYSFLQ